MPFAILAQCARDNVISNVNTSTALSTYGIAISHNATGELHVVVTGNQVLDNRVFGLLVQGPDATASRSETVPGLEDVAFQDRAHGWRTRLHGDGDNIHDETPGTLLFARGQGPIKRPD